MQKPYIAHLLEAKKILKYITGTKDLALKYIKLIFFVLFGFSNYNYGGDKDDRKSTSSYVFSSGSGVISWSYKKQPKITLSTTKEKYRAMKVVAHNAIWLKNILKEIIFK